MGSCPQNWQQGRRLILMPFRELVRTRKGISERLTYNMVLKRASQWQHRWGKAKFLCNISILLGAPLRSCWSLWQTKALGAILMQIRHNLVFYTLLFPRGHNHALWSPRALLSPCRGAAPSCTALLSITRMDKEQSRGSGQGTQLSSSAAKQRQKSLICSTMTGPHVAQVQPSTSDFITLPNDPTSTKDVHRPTSVAGDLSYQLPWWEEHLKRS